MAGIIPAILEGIETAGTVINEVAGAVSAAQAVGHEVGQVSSQVRSVQKILDRAKMSARGYTRASGKRRRYGAKQRGMVLIPRTAVLSRTGPIGQYSTATTVGQILSAGVRRRGMRVGTAKFRKGKTKERKYKFVVEPQNLALTRFTDSTNMYIRRMFRVPAGSLRAERDGSVIFTSHFKTRLMIKPPQTADPLGLRAFIYRIQVVVSDPDPAAVLFPVSDLAQGGHYHIADGAGTHTVYDVCDIDPEMRHTKKILYDKVFRYQYRPVVAASGDQAMALTGADINYRERSFFTDGDGAAPDWGAGISNLFAIHDISLSHKQRVRFTDATDDGFDAEDKGIWLIITSNWMNSVSAAVDPGCAEQYQEYWEDV